MLIAGPGLESGGAELDNSRSATPSEAAASSGATVERSLQALDGAAVAHVAAHGRFREDSPLFSSLELDDGPLTVHDFERLGAPRTGSCCRRASRGWGADRRRRDAGPGVGDAGHGLGRDLSSVAKVNDHATAELMLDVHAAMDEGEELGDVLLRGREAASGDQVREPTAAAFLAMGV